MTKASGTAEEQRAIAYLQWTGWLQDHDRQIYEQGKRDGIEWHPYPLEKPTKEGTYLVTIKYDDEEEACVRTSIFIVAYDCFSGGRFVTAWAELPKPYEKGAEDETD